MPESEDEENKRDESRQDSITGSPTATEHPTGQQQAKENAENEPAG